ncbi:MAG: cation diffusion facilitator family transporter [Oxalobacteraceae bacterium]
MEQVFEHDDSPPEARQQAATKTTLVSAVVNVLLSVVQVLVGLLTSSAGLIADGIHSLTDLAADFIVLLANRHSSKGADEDHQYGHQRYETAASLFLGLSLVAVGTGIAWSAAIKIMHPQTTPVQFAAFYIALFALVTKELLFRYMLMVAERVRSSMLIANAWHARADAASSLVVALGILGSALGHPTLDAVSALIVGLMICKTGAGFAWDALHDLMDRAASAEEYQRITKIVAGTPGVLGVHDLRTRKMGDLIIVDVHIEVDANATVRQGHDIGLLAANRVKAELPVLDVMTHIDPV